MSLKLITGPASEPITLAQAKLHLRIEGSATDEDTIITALITASREAAEHELGRGIGSQTWKLTLDEFPAEAIKLPLAPVASITLVQYFDTAGAAQTLPSSAYVLDNADADQAWLLKAYGYEWPDTYDAANAVQITYVCGLTSTPETVRAWMLLRIGALYEKRSDFEQSSCVDRLLDRYRLVSV